MTPTFRERYIAIHLKVMTFGARCVGVLAVIGGASGLLSFAVFPKHSLGDLIVGVVCLAVGVAFLRAKRLESKDLRWFSRKWK